MEIDPGTTGVAVLISTDEAFALLDHLKGPWRTAVWNAAEESPEVSMVRLNLSTKLEPGLQWGTLFGIMLIVQNVPLGTPHDS